MTLPPVIRIFFGIELPPLAKEKLGTFIGALKKKSKSNSIRWSRPENLHITLQFLAEFHSEHLPLLINQVRTKMATSVKNLTLTCGEIHLFPNPYRPRVIVLDVAPQDHLAKLSELIGLGIQETQYKIETRPFRGHLTLGRIKQPQGINLGFLSEVGKPDLEKIEINEIILFRSEPQPEGSRYTPIERIAFNEDEKNVSS